MIRKRAASSFRIVLLTPDDVGYSKSDGDAQAKPRARQNVILEMGMLLASLTWRQKAKRDTAGHASPEVSIRRVNH